MSTKLPEGIKNNDAYKLMDYRCEICKKVERIWNGRNAVSPFGIHCTCGSTMYHINWYQDIRNKYYVPAKGQRYFADFTKERAEILAKKWIERLDGTEWEIWPERYDEVLINKIHELLHDECAMDILTK